MELEGRTVRGEQWRNIDLLSINGVLALGDQFRQGTSGANNVLWGLECGASLENSGLWACL